MEHDNRILLLAPSLSLQQGGRLRRESGSCRGIILISPQPLSFILLLLLTVSFTSPSPFILVSAWHLYFFVCASLCPDIFFFFVCLLPCIQAPCHFLFMCSFNKFYSSLLLISHQGTSQVTVCLQPLPEVFHFGMCVQKMCWGKGLYPINYV